MIFWTFIVSKFHHNYQLQVSGIWCWGILRCRQWRVSQTAGEGEDENWWCNKMFFSWSSSSFYWTRNVVFFFSRMTDVWVPQNANLLVYSLTNTKIKHNFQSALAAMLPPNSLVIIPAAAVTYMTNDIPQVGKIDFELCCKVSVDWLLACELID